MAAIRASRTGLSASPSFARTDSARARIAGRLSTTCWTSGDRFCGTALCTATAAGTADAAGAVARPSERLTAATADQVMLFLIRDSLGTGEHQYLQAVTATTRVDGVRIRHGGNLSPGDTQGEEPLQALGLSAAAEAVYLDLLHNREAGRADLEAALCELTELGLVERSEVGVV